MKEATIVYPHQLFADSPALNSSRPVFLVEESLILTHNPIHTQKLMFHKLSLDAYQEKLREEGFNVKLLTIKEHPTSASVFTRLQQDGVEKMHIVDTTDNYLEQAIAESGLERVWYDSPLFILPKGEAIERYQKSKRLMASFYKQLRQDKNILLDENGDPTGGQWSFDADNRHKLSKDISLPNDIEHYKNDEITQAEDWVKNVAAEQYGENGCWLPYTHKDAQGWLQVFLQDRLADFGTYEDALTQRSVRVFHSALSPLLNVGLLTPQEILDEALVYAKENNTPLNSIEGFVRQILGWREFIRAAYECDGVTMRSKNFWKHTRPLPKDFWSGTTGLIPLDSSINRALSYGYNHHIERLMVLGNFMLLSQIDPDEVYRWFMGMYVDAYDWVMVPNVYGMSQFADGGSFATKPYISGSNYIKKMSDYPKGTGEQNWEDVWTALYWNFIATHIDFFKSNHRLSMMPRLLEKMDIEKKRTHERIASEYLSKIPSK